MDNTLYCKKCKKEVEFKEVKSGVHMKAICKECDSYIKFIPQPLEMIRVPFGKYKGDLLVEIVPKDRDYFQWLLNENALKGIMKERVGFLLEE